MPTVNRVKRPWIPEKPKAETNASWGGNDDSRWYKQSKWQGYRKAQIRDEPLCRICKQAGKLTPATVVDHIKPVKLGGEKYDMDNLQSLCASCHNKKSNSERRDIKGS